MTYLTGRPIQASDYNGFSTQPGGINQIYADIYPGSVPSVLGTFNSNDVCTFGYGQVPALLPVTIGSPIKATQWASLFDKMRILGTHQGGTVSPPVPTVNPIAGGTVIAYNTPAFMSVIQGLHSNRFNVATGQTALTIGAPFSSSAVWSSSLTFLGRIDFGSWNNARYFFNSGGHFTVNASFSPRPPITPESIMWQQSLSFLSNTKIDYKSATNPYGSIVANKGFYGLTNQWQTIYSKTSGGGSGGYYYASNLCVIRAKYESVGLSGVVNISIELTDGDSYRSPKNGTTTCWINTLRSVGAVEINNPVITGTFTLS